MPVPAVTLPFSPRQSTFSNAAGTLIQWSNGENFDGYLWIGTAIPKTAGGLIYPYMSKGNGSYPRQRLPLICCIPIYFGNFDQNSRYWYNADIDPPNSQYFGIIYDNNNNQIAPLAAPFTITGPNTPITIPVLTVPTINNTPPVPDSTLPN